MNWMALVRSPWGACCPVEPLLKTAAIGRHDPELTLTMSLGFVFTKTSGLPSGVVCVMIAGVERASIQRVGALFPN